MVLPSGLYELLGFTFSRLSNNVQTNFVRFVVLGLQLSSKMRIAALVQEYVPARNSPSCPPENISLTSDDPTCDIQYQIHNYLLWYKYFLHRMATPSFEEEGPADTTGFTSGIGRRVNWVALLQISIVNVV